MSATEPRRDYWNLEGLGNVYLEDSYVLAIIDSATSIAFHIEFVLTKTHPRYADPLEGEQYCYRRGKIAFSNVRTRHWVERTMRQTIDLDGTIDYGNIDTFWERSGTYFLTGDWGTIHITSDKPVLELFD